MQSSPPHSRQNAEASKNWSECLGDGRFTSKPYEKEWLPSRGAQTTSDWLDDGQEMREASRGNARASDETGIERHNYSRDTWRVSGWGSNVQYGAEPRQSEYSWKQDSAWNGTWKQESGWKQDSGWEWKKPDNWNESSHKSWDAKSRWQQGEAAYTPANQQTYHDGTDDLASARGKTWRGSDEHDYLNECTQTHWDTDSAHGRSSPWTEDTTTGGKSDAGNETSQKLTPENSKEAFSNVVSEKRWVRNEDMGYVMRSNAALLSKMRSMCGVKLRIDSREDANERGERAIEISGSSGAVAKARELLDADLSDMHSEHLVFDEVFVKRLVDGTLDEARDITGSAGVRLEFGFSGSKRSDSKRSVRIKGPRSGVETACKLLSELYESKGNACPAEVPSSSSQPSQNDEWTPEQLNNLLRQGLEQLCEGTVLQPDDFDWRSRRFLQILYVKDNPRVYEASQKIVDAVDGVERDKIRNWKAYVYTLLRRFSPEVHEQIKNGGK